MKDVSSEYIIKTLLNRPRVAYEQIKFNIIMDKLRNRFDEGAKPVWVDLGAGHKSFDYYISHQQNDKLEFNYTSVDIEPVFQPDIVGSITDLDAIRDRLPEQPSIVSALDVLEHLPGKKEDIRLALKNIASVSDQDTIILISLPQMYRLDALKLSHLNYPEHTVRFTQHEWRELIEEELEVEELVGVGYIMVIPYLLMLNPWFEKSPFTVKVYRFIKHKILNNGFVIKLDTAISKLFGKTRFSPYANGILFVCKIKG